mgnify:CR=1 FL=1
MFLLVNADYKDGSVKVQEIVNELVFGVRGDFNRKMMIFFEVNSQTNEDRASLSKEFLKNYLTGILCFYEEIYTSAQEISSELLKYSKQKPIFYLDHLKRSKQDRIYFDDFKDFCFNFPSAMDFISRITIGECPNPNSDQIITANQNHLTDTNPTTLQGLPSFHEERNEKQSESVPEHPFLNKRWVKKISSENSLFINRFREISDIS